MEPQAQPQKTFSTSRPIQLKAITDRGLKTIQIRFPTDDEWIERGRRRKVITRNLGRGLSEQIVPEPDEQELGFFKRLILEQSETEVDEFEASRIIEELGRSRIVDDPVFEDGFYSVILEVFGIQTKHYLRMPTGKERHTFNKSFAQARSQGSKDIYSFNLGVAGTLYGAISNKAENYDGPVSVVHALAILQALFQTIDKELGIGGEENF